MKLVRGQPVTGVTADPIHLQEDTKYHHPQRPHNHLWCANTFFIMLRAYVSALPIYLILVPAS